MKPTLELLLGKSNEELSKLTDSEIEEYLKESLVVSVIESAEVSRDSAGAQVISLKRPAGSNLTSRPKTTKHKGPSILAQELLKETLDREEDDVWDKMVVDLPKKIELKKK